jgi:hypothetical protein
MSEYTATEKQNNRYGNFDKETEQMGSEIPACASGEENQALKLLGKHDTGVKDGR